MRRDALLPIEDVCRQSGLSRRSVYALMKAGKFPRVIKAGVTSRWSENEVQDWIDARKAERDQALSPEPTDAMERRM